jgi:2,5-diketo-D-gluconate reductase B
LTLSEADMALIAGLDRGQRLTSPKGIAPHWD